MDLNDILGEESSCTASAMDITLGEALWLSHRKTSPQNTLPAAPILCPPYLVHLHPAISHRPPCQMHNSRPTGLTSCFDTTVLTYACPVTAEGDAALIVVPDSNVLMNRPANLLRFAQLLDSVGSQVVEGQDNLAFTAKILFPFTVTRELDCMKDPRSGTLPPFSIVQRLRR